MSPQPIDLPLRPVALQGVPAPGYSAVDLRRMALAGQAQEGVIGGGDGKVTQRAAGAGLAVDVAAGEFLVQGDSIANQGLYYALLAAAATGAGELTVRAGDGQPRIDQVVLQILDTQHDGSGLNVARLRIIEGTPTAGATLDNRLGAAALPSSCVRLADYRMLAAAGSVPTAEIRDRRTWARGALRSATRTAGDYSTTSGTLVALDGTNLSPRIECSGVPLRISAAISGNNNGAGGAVGAAFLVDGLPPTGLTTASIMGFGTSAAAGQEQNIGFSWPFTPPAGSHVIALAGRVGSGTGTFRGNANSPLAFAVEEIVRQNADNT